MQSLQKEERNASLDILRIIAMFMIMSAHFLGWGGAVNKLTTSDLNYFIIMPIYFFCQIGNILFFLLAGYFAKKPKVNKVLFIQRKTWFYSFFITLIIFIFGLDSGTGFGYTIKSFFPLIFNKYWFISAYLVLYLLSFLLVPGLDSLSKSQFWLIILALIINNTCFMSDSYTIMEGLLAYVIGYYLNKFKPYENCKWIWTILAYFSIMAVYIAERLLVRKLGVEHSKLDETVRYILLLSSAVALFMFFAQIRVRAKWASSISGNLLSIYLITANPALVPLLYTKLLRIEAFCGAWWFVGYYLAVNVVLFVLCVAIDKVVTILNKKEVSFIERICNKLFTKKEEIINVDENSKV